jgi:hypothetical protein
MGRSRFRKGLRNLVKWINGKSEKNFKNKTLKSYFTRKHLLLSLFFIFHFRWAILIYISFTPLIYIVFILKIMYKFICWRDSGAIFLQDSADPRQIVCDLPMTQRGPAEKAASTWLIAWKSFTSTPYPSCYLLDEVFHRNIARYL